jgi:hypothetical protein
MQFYCFVAIFDFCLYTFLRILSGRQRTMSAKNPINYNQLAYLANQSPPDLVRLRVVPSAGKWQIEEGVLEDDEKREHPFGRLITSRNVTKMYATLDSVRTDLLRAFHPYHPNFILLVEEKK